MNTKYFKFVWGVVWLFLGMFALQAQTPGGVSANYLVWLTPDTYNDGVWTNKITSTVGNFSRFQSPLTGTVQAPKVTGYNFHPAVRFATTANTAAPNQMESSANFNIGTGESFTIFIVTKRGTSGNGSNNDYLLGYGATGVTGARGVYYGSGSNSTTLHQGWPLGTARTLGTAPSGLIAIDNPNTTSVINFYSNGGSALGSANANGSVNNPMRIGSMRNNSSGQSGFNGDIQEIIILKRSATGYMQALDIQKIQSYLAIKYGITLGTGDYVNSAETKVWTRSDNSGYDKNIFGIGRDDASGLYQKQSQSVTSALTTVFTGSKVTSLNVQNEGTIANDASFVMLGSNGSDGVEMKNIANGTPYANGIVSAINGLNILSKTIYKAQVTNYTDMVNLAVNMGEYIYVLVSSQEDFDPDHTRIYPISSSGIATVKLDQTWKYIRYAGYSHAFGTAGPGGITTDLKLWLNAENEASLAIDYVDAGSGSLSGYTGQYGNTALPAGALPAVKEWKDLVRSKTYEYPSNRSIARTPVFFRKPMETNYHPSIQFWGNSSATHGSAISAYLVNRSGLMDNPNPKNSTSREQTVIIMSNNSDPYRSGSGSGGNNRTYFMGFGSSTSLDDLNGAYNFTLNPAYGISRLSSTAANTYTMFNNGFSSPIAYSSSASAVEFPIGATTVLSWRTNSTGSNNLYVDFGINGKTSGPVNSDNRTSNAFMMNSPSTLGAAYVPIRQVVGLISEVIIFEKKLSDDELKTIESYMGIKYGITLRDGLGYYDYKLSELPDGSNTTFWEGKVAPFNLYHNNVSAVIRDDAAGLHNAQSHSTNVGSILHMGVAGTRLGFHSSVDDVGDLDYDREVIVWGSNSDTGIDPVQMEDCGDFNNIFKRKWLVHKRTHDNRPITMLVGAQNNSTNNLGLSAAQAIQDMYNKLGAGYDVCLIVGDSETDIDNHIYRAVVPMSFIDGEHQCSYTFSKEYTYITFGYKASTTGCGDNTEFSGKKTADWTVWSRSNYGITGTSQQTITPKNVPFVPIDLGADIKVTDMKITYDNGVRSANYYPVTGNSPFKGGLQLRRNRGSVNNSKVTVEINFNHPVVPGFSIAGLDAYYRQFDAVQIVGYCNGGGVLPKLSYAGNPKNAYYTITGGKATVGKTTRNASGSSVNSRVDINFEGGVDKIVIEYTIAGRVDFVFSSNQEIYISPITLSPVPPTPPVNEDGLSFVKEVKEHNISTCEPVEYSFYIQNTNCEDKYVQFSDTLPAGMKWENESLAMDTANYLHNNKLSINNYGGTDVLDIDSIVIPGTTTIKLKAVAVFDKNAPGGQYDNRAVISYQKLVESLPEWETLQSRDRETLEEYTSFDATQTQRQDTIFITVVRSPQKYAANEEIAVTYTVKNPNAALSDMFLDISFDANFTYKPGSFSSSEGTAVLVTPDPDAPTIIGIAGGIDGSTGFNLPTGESTFTFTLKAPKNAGLDVTTDGKKSDLTISYEFTTTMNDPCVIVLMPQLSGETIVPYGVAHIKTNNNTTTKIGK